MYAPVVNNVLFLFSCIVVKMAVMVWTDQHDTMLCREILTLNPFQSKKSSVQRGQIWHAIAVNLVSIRELHFKVDRRAVRDRYNLLSGKLRRKLKDEERASGIDTDMTETEVSLEGKMRLKHS